MGLKQTALAFFDACETGKGWAGCNKFCWSDATFSSQAEPLTEVSTLEAYTNWMRDLLTPIPDGSYELKAFAEDEERRTVLAFAVFAGTNTGPGGPNPPTGRSARADYVYAMEFEGEKIRHMTKIWNAGWSLRQLGWA